MISMVVFCKWYPSSRDCYFALNFTNIIASS